MPTRARPEGCCPLLPVRRLRSSARDRQVRLFKALADPTRLEILRLLSAQTGPVCACDLVDHFELAQPTISHHLKILREAGLLTSSRFGIWSFYAVDPEGVALLREVPGLAGEPADRSSRASRGQPAARAR